MGSNPICLLFQFSCFFARYLGSLNFFNINLNWLAKNNVWYIISNWNESFQMTSMQNKLEVSILTCCHFFHSKVIYFSHPNWWRQTLKQTVDIFINNIKKHTWLVKAKGKFSSQKNHLKFEFSKNRPITKVINILLIIPR